MTIEKNRFQSYARRLKHFKTIAKTLRANKAGKDLCWGLAQEFKQFHNLFDVNRFMTACGH